MNPGGAVAGDEKMGRRIKGELREHSEKKGL